MHVHIKEMKLILVSLLSILPLVASQVYPGSYIFLSGNVIMSVNGSSEDGNCSGVILTTRCNAPRTSVLYDGITPNLTGLDGNMWATQLLTINTANPTTDITFDFRNTTGYVGVERAVVVMFNCPEWRISVDSIILFGSTTSASIGNNLGTISPTITSCDSLVRVCISRQVSSAQATLLTLRFKLSPGSTWVHLAEVTYYGSGLTCPEDIILNPPTTPPPTTSAGVTTESDPSSNASDSSTMSTMSTTSSSTVENTGGSPPTTAIVVAVVIIIIVIAIVIILVVVILLFCIRSKDPTNTFYAKFSSLRGGTLEKAPDVELRGNKRVDNAVYDDVVNHKESDSVAKGGGVYEGIDDVPTSRYEKTGESYSTVGDGGRSSASVEDQTYNRLRENEIGRGRSATTQLMDLNYSKINRGESLAVYSVPSETNATKGANNPIYSDPDAIQERRFTSPPYVSAPKLASSTVPQPIQDEPILDAEYAVIGTTGAPEIPKKSENLVDYLETKPYSGKGTEQEVGLSTNPSPNKPITPTNNPLYASVDNMDNVYAEPGAAAIPELNPGGSIYEAIYSESLNPDSFVRELSPIESQNSDDLCPYSSIYTVPVVPTSNKPLEITEGNIEKVKVLGSGNFGKVYLAKTVGLSCRDLRMSASTDTNVMVQVAVKMLKPNASVSTRNLFDKECRFMSRLNHPNVIRLLGICKTNTPYIMMEYMENGDLNQFLQEYELVVDGDAPGDLEIARRTLTSVCTQIANAMNYLASNNFVHRDLATRNVLVGENFRIKIADFGMSRSLYDSHYYIIKGHAILPIRWMATECFYGKFSAKTDVWAFGATMWEVFMLSKNEPYCEMDDRSVVNDAIKGADRTILSRPKDCPAVVYNIMMECFHNEPGKRATFEQLYNSLSQF